MLIHCTTCAAAKHPSSELLPALERYLSERIDTIAAEAKQKGIALFILSGKYGLIDASTPIAYYDQKLLLIEVEAMTNKVSMQLKDNGITELHFYGTPVAHDTGMSPYLQVLNRACALANVGLQMHFAFGADSFAEKPLN